MTTLSVGSRILIAAQKRSRTYSMRGHGNAARFVGGRIPRMPRLEARSRVHNCFALPRTPRLTISYGYSQPRKSDMSASVPLLTFFTGWSGRARRWLDHNVASTSALACAGRARAPSLVMRSSAAAKVAAAHSGGAGRMGHGTRDILDSVGDKLRSSGSRA